MGEEADYLRTQDDYYLDEKFEYLKDTSKPNKKGLYQCTLCKKFKPKTEFYKDKRVPCGIRSKCKVRLDKYWCDEERMYSYVEDFDSLVEDYIDYNYEQYEHLTDEELCQLAKDKINSYNWTSAIIVYIEPL